MHFKILFWTRVSFLSAPPPPPFCHDILVFETKHGLQERAVCSKDYVILLSASQLTMKDIILFSSMAEVTIKELPDTVQLEGHR